MSAEQSNLAYPVYTVTVNYDLSVEDAVAAGKYDRKECGITSNVFVTSRTGTAKVEIILAQFSGVMTKMGDAIRKLDEQGLRPAGLPELLAFGEQYPDVQRKFSLVALGSELRFSGFSEVAHLCGDADKRWLCLDITEIDGSEMEWPKGVRFAAVRK